MVGFTLEQGIFLYIAKHDIKLNLEINIQAMYILTIESMQESGAPAVRYSNHAYLCIWWGMIIHMHMNRMLYCFTVA